MKRRILWASLAALVLAAIPAPPAAGTRPRSIMHAPLRGPAPALPASLDTDGDGWIDTVEINLGSDPANASSTPESVSVAASCMDGADDDLNGLIDEADPGCEPPDLSTDRFPPAGSDRFESTMALDGYELVTPLGTCPLDFDGTGPTVVERGAPVGAGGGLREVDTEIVAMQLSGTGTLLPGSPCNPGSSPTSFPATILEDPAQASAGKLTDTDPRPARDFPADSFFDVLFLIDTPLGLLPGGPPDGPMGDPVRVSNTVRSIPPYYTPANPKLNPDCYTVAGLPHQHCPKPPLDHFKCYGGRFPAFDERRVTLEDQFESKKTQVVRANRFCNPVSKNGQEIFDPGGHLKRYRIRDVRGQPPFGGLGVLVQNQFGDQGLTVERPIGLFVPSRKGSESKPVALDHYKCYAVQGAQIGEKVTLEDQFDVEDGRVEKASVLEPVTLCNPVAKTVHGVIAPVGDPAWHLVCYAIETRRFRPRTVIVRNQFGKERVRVREPIELCVPSMKTEELPPVEVDDFPDSELTVHISTPDGSEAVRVNGDTTVKVNLAEIGDTDDDGLEQVPTHVTEMQLTGTSELYGSVSITFREASEDPGQAPVGEIEERVNDTPGVLDVPPFTETGVADSFFDIAFEVTLAVQNVQEVLHTCVPLKPTGTITRKPPDTGEAMTTERVVQLCDAQDQPTSFQFGPLTFVPNPG